MSARTRTSCPNAFRIDLADDGDGCTRLRFHADFQLRNIALRAVLRGARLDKSFAKVRAGGLIAGDDYRVAGWWGNDVVRAVNEFLAEHDARMVFTLDGQFVIEKLRA